MNASKLLTKAIQASSVAVLQGCYDEYIKNIKQYCRHNGDCTIDMVRYLVIDASSNKSLDNRLKCLEIMDILFNRSKLFRKTLCESSESKDRQGSDSSGNSYIRKLLISAGVLSERHDDSARRLSCKADVIAFKKAIVSLILSWGNSFDNHYPELRATCRYLRESASLGGDTADIIHSLAYNLNTVTNRQIYKVYMQTVEDMKSNLKTVKSMLKTLEYIEKIMNEYNNYKSTKNITQSSTLELHPKVHQGLHSTDIPILRNLDKFLSFRDISNEAQSSSFNDRKRHFDDSTLNEKIIEVGNDDESSKESHENNDEDIDWIYDEEYTNEDSVANIETTNYENFDDESFSRARDSMHVHLLQNILPIIHKWEKSISDANALFENHSIDKLKSSSNALLTEINLLKTQADKLSSRIDA